MAAYALLRALVRRQVLRCPHTYQLPCLHSSTPPPNLGPALQFFLDGVMDAMEKEQSGLGTGAGAGGPALQPSRRVSAPMGGSLRASSAAPASAGGGSGRFASARRSQQ